MAEKLTDAFRNAESSFLENKLDEALAGFVTVAKADPDHLWVRFRIGSTLEAMKIHQRAAEVYKALAWHCIKAGYPLLGLVAVKRAMGIQATFEGSLDTLADLYSLESDRIDQNMALFGLTDLDADKEIETLDTQPEKMPALAAQVAQDFADPRYPSRLPAIPLFSMPIS